VYCHPNEVEFAAAEMGGIPEYWDMDQIPSRWVRFLYKRFLHRRWDGGAVKVADTIEEDDEVAGFKVVHFPGHAPGLIGLWRESDRLLLSTDAIYLVDAMKLKALPEEERPTVPHWIYNWDQDAAKESVRKLAALEPRTVWTGHEEAFEGEPAELRRRLEAAADAAP
jgi:glyoxylase-like metal-dependent hydrolase (beta-lactamase superfamily II)